MADQPTFFGFLLNILSSLGQGIAGTDRHAQEAAKEAKAAKEAAQRQQKGGSGGGRSGFGGVIDGLIPETRNAKSITAVLSQGIFGKSALPPAVPATEPAPSSPTIGYTPQTQPGDFRGLLKNLLGRRAAQKPPHIESLGAFADSVGFADQGPVELQPQAPRRRGSFVQRARGAWQAWRSRRAEAQWHRENGPLPMDDEGIERHREEERERSMPFPSRIGRRIARRIGSGLVNRGAAMGGRVGGAMSEIGSFMGGRAATGAAAEGAAAVGGTAAAAEGAAAVGGTAAIAEGAAAVGRTAAAALAIPGVGEVTAAVGLLVGFTAATIATEKAFEALSKSILESSRDFAKFHGGIAIAFAKMERQELRLGQQMAGATGGTMQAGANAYMELRTAIEPFKEATGNLKNMMGVSLANIANSMSVLLNILTGPMGYLAILLAEVNGVPLESLKIGKQPPASPWAGLLAGMTGGAGGSFRATAFAPRLTPAQSAWNKKIDQAETHPGIVDAAAGGAGITAGAIGSAFRASARLLGAQF